MKKQLSIILLSAAVLISCGRTEKQEANYTEPTQTATQTATPVPTKSASDIKKAENGKFSDDIFTVHLDKNVLCLFEKGITDYNFTIAIRPNDENTSKGTHNTITIANCLEYSEYSDNYKKYKKDIGSLAEELCNEFVIDDGIEIEKEKVTNNKKYTEFYRKLSDGTKCYARVYYYSERYIAYTLCRLCEYSEKDNDKMKSAYDSIKISEELLEEEVYEYYNFLLQLPTNPVNFEKTGAEDYTYGSREYEAATKRWIEACDEYEDESAKETAKKFNITKKKVNELFLKHFETE